MNRLAIHHATEYAALVLNWAPECIPIYFANVETWLATDPDLSDIEG